MRSEFGTARRSRAQWQDLIARAARSSLGVAAFCRGEGVSAASFYTWRKRLSEAASPAAPAADAPVFLDLGSLGAEAGVAAGGWQIELDLGAGVVLRLRRG